MPNNCSTLIQRKQNILHKILRGNSEGKLQNAVAETTSTLRVAGTHKAAGYSSSSNQLTNGSAGTAATTRRSTLFTTNRVQPTTDHGYGTLLPSIRDAAGAIERQQQVYDNTHSRSRPKTPVTTNASPKSAGRPPSASISSLFNTLSKRSTENFMSSNGELDDLNIPSSRQSRRASNESGKYGIITTQTPTKLTVTPQKHSGDSGFDSRYSASSPDTNHHQQQQRVSGLSNRLRPTAPNVQVESPLTHETPTKERTNAGQLYQRRTNNNIKTPIKQKIDKYRRRSEEVTHGINGNILLNTANNGLSATTHTLTTPPSARTRAPPTPTPVRRVTSDAEIQGRLEVLRLSMDTNVVQTAPPAPPPAQQNGYNRIKSPYLYATHQQLAPSTTPPTASILLRRTQPISTTTQTPHRSSNGVTYRRQQQSSIKQSTNTGQGNLYLAFIASRHLSTLEDTLFECDIDHPKLLRIFSWLKNVEEHRYEQSDHDKLLVEQNQRMVDQIENLSLYSEIQYAVDDIPPNTSGKPCEKIATMQFED